MAFRGIDALVQEYFVVDGGKTFDEHVFSVQVKCEDKDFMVDRSYADFVELDRRLRKMHPRTSLRELPLASAKLVPPVSNVPSSSSSASHWPGLKSMAATPIQLGTEVFKKLALHAPLHQQRPSSSLHRNESKSMIRFGIPMDCEREYRAPSTVRLNLSRQPC